MGIMALVPKGIKSWLRERISRVTAERMAALDSRVATLEQSVGSAEQRLGSAEQRLEPLENQVMSTSVIKYIPYRSDEQCFALPKGPGPDCDRCEFGLPIAPDSVRTGWFGQPSDVHLAARKADVDAMLRILESSGADPLDGCRILDFACADGRMTRHLYPFAESCEIWGVDITAEAIYWCQRYLCPPFRFATTTTVPHLPFEDGYFNLFRIHCRTSAGRLKWTLANHATL